MTDSRTLFVRTCLALAALAAFANTPSASHGQTAQSAQIGQARQAGPASGARPSAPSGSKAAAQPANANTNANANTVAAQVQSFYDQTRDISATFAQSYFYKIYNRYDRSKGSVVFKKPGKMRWDYSAPNGKIVVANGKEFLVYEPGDKAGEPGQVLQQPLQQSELPSAMSFLIGQGKLAQDFQPKLLDAAANGFKGGYVLELKPNKPTPQYDRVVLYVDASPSRLGFVHRVLVLDSAGNRNRFDFTDIRFNRNVPDSTFAWQPPKGTRRIKAPTN